MEGLATAEAYIIKGLDRYPLVSFRLEHNPVGIVPSVGECVLAVNVDSAVTEELPEYSLKSSPPTTGGSPANYFNGVGKVSGNVFSGGVPLPVGDGSSFTVPEGVLEANKGLSENIPNLTDLLSGEFSVVLKSYVGKPRPNGAPEIEEREIRIRGLMPRYVEGSRDAPIELNKIAVVRLTFMDGRAKWSRQSNFSDEINILKGVDANGNAVYENDSVYNPGADIQSRRAWSASDFVRYMVALIDKEVVGGNRSTGFIYSFPEDGDDEQRERQSSARSARLVVDASLNDNIVEGISVKGGNPANELSKVLKRWGYTIIYPHDGDWYIDRVDRSPLYPREELRGESANIVPQSANVRALRAKNVVVHGNPIRLQEGFTMEEHDDFDYVIPLGGEWIQLDYAWKRVKKGITPSSSDYDDAQRAGYLSADERLRLALLSAVPADGDYEAYRSEAGFAESVEKATAIETRSLLKALISIAVNGFKYVRLRRDGVYGQFRRPEPKLVAIDETGDENRPRVIHKGWGQVEVRNSVSARNNFNIIDLVSEYFQAVPEDKLEEIQGQTDERIKEKKNLKDFFKIQAMEQGLSLVDADAVVFSVGEKMIYPTRLSPQGASEEIVVSPGGVPVGENFDLAGKLIRQHTDYDWARSEQIDVLLASTFAGAPESQNNLPGGVYYSEFSSDDGYDGTDYQFQDHLRLDAVLATLVFGDDGYEIQSYDGTTDGTKRLEIANTATVSPMDFFRDNFGSTSVGRQLDRIDAEAERLVKAYYDSARHSMGAEYDWPGVVVPAGGSGSDGDERVWYSSQLRTIVWACDGNGIFTFARFNSDEPYSPFVGEYRRQYVEWINQRTMSNTLPTFASIRKQATALSGGKHNE